MSDDNPSFLESKAVAWKERVIEDCGISLPWLLILQIFLELIAQCFKTQGQFILVAKNPTWMQRFAMRLFLSRELRKSERVHDVRRAAESLQSVILADAAKGDETSMCKAWEEYQIAASRWR